MVEFTPCPEAGKPEDIAHLEVLVDASLKRIRLYDPGTGLFGDGDGLRVAISGGKDSRVLGHLADESGVPHRKVMNLTSVDPPQLLDFVRREMPDVEMVRPKLTMWQLIAKERLLPQRHKRFCCRVLKEETTPPGGIVATGIRAEESKNRANRRVVEACSRGKGRWVLNPIIDWRLVDVWNYIITRGLSYCSLYDEGFERIGCIMCPCGGSKTIKREAERWPKFAEGYRRAAHGIVRQWQAAGVPDMDIRDGDDYYERWISGKRMRLPGGYTGRKHKGEQEEHFVYD